MLFRVVLALVVVLPSSRFAVDAGGVQPNAAGEYSKHFGALSRLSIAVAEAMPPDQYGFRPHPEFMNFEDLIAHIATTNYQFCAGLKDSDPPSLPPRIDKHPVVKFLSDSFEYCSAVIPNLTEEQLNKTHNSPDENLLGREVFWPCTFMWRIIGGRPKSISAIKASSRRPIGSERLSECAY
jgi:hypothetical protein